MVVTREVSYFDTKSRLLLHCNTTGVSSESLKLKPLERRNEKHARQESTAWQLLFE